ncbi:MAG TPA: rhodanese-like domain-containing protein [Candidatus Aquilonibacter sp.]|nr:rhodanese-like domain-containing protein [Candidatus Aquilonibacter sp.]
MRNISVHDLARWRSEGTDFVLLDVREPYEVQTASIPGSTVISMREIPQRLGELPRDKPIAVLCHHGGRSERVASFLRSQGFSEVSNVDGGIDAYARAVDPAIPRY